MSQEETHSALDAFIDVAFERFDEAGDDLSQLEEPFRTIVIITSAQGVIDNGGLRAFFECDWPGTPPYSWFIEAYDRIGCQHEASAIRRAANSFGLDAPERHVEERIAFIEARYDEESLSVAGWEEGICANPDVWSGLLGWAIENRTSEGASGNRSHG